MRRRLSALLVPVFVAFALLTAACGDDSGAAAGAAPTGSTGSTVAGDTTAPPSTESADPVTLHLAVLRQHHPWVGARGHRQRHLREDFGLQRRAEDVDLQRRHGRDRSALRRGDRRRLHRAEPRGERLRQVER